MGRDFSCAQPNAELTGIDGLQIADYLVHTIEADEQFILRGCAIIGDDITGWASSPTISLGSDSPNYSNLTGAIGIASLNGSGLVRNIPVLAITNVMQGPTELRIKVSVAAVATKYILRVVVTGFFL